jgi:hypothetical protein
MERSYKKYSNLIFLFIFILVVLSVNFLHTEKTIKEDNNCPACQFQHSSLTTAQINFFILSPPAFLNLLTSQEFFNYVCFFAITSNSRSPPQI